MEELPGADQSGKSSVESVNINPEQTDDAFAVIERDYNKTLYDLEKDETTLPFIENFTKLFQALFKTYASERELTTKCKDYKEKIDANQIQLELSKKLADSDFNTIQEMKNEIEQTWKIADTAHARELAAQDLIDNLRTKVGRLSGEVEMLKKIATQQDVDDSPETAKTKEALQRDKEKLQSDVNQLELKLNDALTYQDEIEKKLSTTNIQLENLTSEVTKMSINLHEQTVTIDNLKEEKREYVNKFQEKEIENAKLKSTLDESRRYGVKMENKVKDLANHAEKVEKDSELLIQKIQKLQMLLENQRKETYDLQMLLNMKLNDLKLKEGEIKALYNDISSFENKIDLLEKKLNKAEQDTNVLNVDRQRLRQNISGIEREIELTKRSADADKREKENVIRERDILNKNILRHEAVARDHIKLIKIAEQVKKKLQVDVECCQNESNRQKKSILNLEKERDRLTEETLDLTTKIRDMMDEIKVKKKEIVDFLKEIAENEMRIRWQKSMYETVRSERNAIQKTLQESTTECGELKNKLKISNHLSEQLKEDIAGKQNLIIKGENIIKKLVKEKENLKVEINNGLDHIRQLKDELSEMKSEEKRLHRVILENDMIIRSQAKDLEALMNERDIIGTQLVRRNDELTLLYEKINILESTLQRGEAQYDQRLDDIKLLKIEIKRLRMEKNLLCKSITNATDLRVEVFHLERDLTRERLKCRALEEEIQNPLNVHRWRKLEGSDPELLELLQKIQLLQKRLLKQSSAGIERERQLRGCERMYLNLKQVLAKQPGPEVFLELTKTQKVLKHRGNQMKCLVSELNMYESQNTEYRLNVDKLTNELRELKQKYLTIKKEHLNCGQLPPISKGTIGGANQRDSVIRFTGGGYRMSVNNTQ